MTLHHFFIYAALFGAALFGVQWVLAAIGGDHADANLGEVDAATGHDLSSDFAFKVLSVQGLSAFFTLFGLTGLALESQTGLPMAVIFGGAFCAGWFTTFVLSRIFHAARKLEGSGTLDLKNALGADARVYLRISPSKPGKVTLTVQGRLVEADAVSETGTFETGVRVHVARVLPDGTLVVERPNP